MMKNRGLNFLRKSKGFTLVELVVVMTIIFVTSGILATIVSETVVLWLELIEQRTAVAEINSAMDRMVREMRQVSTLTDVLEADTDSFRFQRYDDDDEDGYWDDLREIRFIQLDSDDLVMQDKFFMGLPGNAGIIVGLLKSTNGLNFVYYSGLGTLAIPQTSPQATDIKLISIFMDKANGRRRLKSWVAPRNLNLR